MTENRPYILEETDDYAVVYKPPQMHSAPLSRQDGGTLFEWYRQKLAAEHSSEVNIMHRLDFETHGLVLFAKNSKSFDFFKSLQDRGEFVKEYSAICSANSVPVNDDGFPPPPAGNPRIIMSYFRPFGPGRKLVRPVTDDSKKYHETAKDNGGFYRTEIADISGNVFTVRIKRGFRHQIRCHLCWIGRPILNDPLYFLPSTEAAIPSDGEPETNALQANSFAENLLALRAHAVFFTDPSSGERKECRINSINGDE
jgi:23S rRNA pseudouridine1911/1915/1917 synthase